MAACRAWLSVTCASTRATARRICSVQRGRQRRVRRVELRQHHPRPEQLDLVGGGERIRALGGAHPVEGGAPRSRQRAPRGDCLRRTAVRSLPWARRAGCPHWRGRRQASRAARSADVRAMARSSPLNCDLPFSAAAATARPGTRNTAWRSPDACPTDSARSISGTCGRDRPPAAPGRCRWASRSRRAVASRCASRPGPLVAAARMSFTGRASASATSRIFA